MPTYVFQCTNPRCSRVTELFVKCISEMPQTVDVNCHYCKNKIMIKIPAAVAVLGMNKYGSSKKN